MKYPIGIQSFEDLRNKGCVYIDKTAFVYRLVDQYKYVFLGRPRRFGKSLLLSTIEAYFEGRKELFKGLFIEMHESRWDKYPVLHFDLNTGDYLNDGISEIRNVLNYQLCQYEKIYGGIDDTLSNRFINLIRKAHDATGKNVVVLIDEYDKPILSTMGSEKAQEEARSALKSFYGCLKSSDRYIRFAMLTGVSKFGKLSVFSDLNNIEDISLNKGNADICGLTEEELIKTFDKEIDDFADECQVSRQQMIIDLRKKYDGYRFSKAKNLVYNPFSLLNSIKNRELRDFWFESGTPTFLVKLLQANDYDLTEIDGVMVDEDFLYKVDNVSAIPILYQSGYLTIKNYDLESGLYELGYPNEEVKAGFLNYLLPYYSNMARENTKSELYRLTKEIKAGEIEAFMGRLKSVFYSVPYSKDNSAKVQEDQIRNLTYLIFMLLGMHIQVECPMSTGRSDAIVWTNDHIYVFEFKIDSTPEVALAQIHKRGYAEPYCTDGRKVVLVGVNYSTQVRAITGWIIE